MFGSPSALSAAVPTITSLRPSSTVAGGGEFSLTIYGADFAYGATAKWGATALTTTCVSGTKLTATVPATLISSARTATVTVTTPSGTSNPIAFTVLPKPPTITSLSPSAIAAGGPDLSLTIYGTHFDAGATARWGAGALATTYMRGTKLVAVVPASLITSAGTASVIVTAAGGASNQVAFTVRPKAPSIASVSPSSTVAGGGEFSLTIYGANFTSGATAKWGTTTLTTTYVSETQLMATVPATLISSARTVSMTVSSTSGASTPAAFTVTPRPPSVTSVSPSSTAAGGPDLSLTIYGAHFVSGTTATWGATALATSYVSATRIIATVPATLLSSEGSASVTVTTTGGVSSPVTFTVRPKPPTITSVSVSCSPDSLLSTQISTCNAIVTGTGTYSNAVTWSAAGGSTNAAGVFTPAGAGTGLITATSAQDPSKSASMSIEVKQATPLQMALPHLAAIMEDYDFSAQSPIVIASFGSSVGVGATLPDAATQAPCGHFVAELRRLFPGPDGQTYNFVCANQSVNGSISVQFPAAWQELTQYALSGVSIASGGAGCAVGDWMTVNQAENANGGAVIVTAADANGSATAIAPSAYPGCITLADTSRVTTNLYSVAEDVPTTNGPPRHCSVQEQTGKCTGLTVNIDAIGYSHPAVALFGYGMNDAGALEYNTGETLQGGIKALNRAIQTVTSAGADAVVLTSPHASQLWLSGKQWTWSAQIGCVYPEFMSNCVKGVFPNPSEVDTAQSLTTADLANTGIPISVSSRMIVINKNYRQLATQNKIPYIDAESYWFVGLAHETAALGDQLAAEKELFSVAGPHPNLLGHQLSYQLAIDDFLTSLAPQ